MQRSSGGWGVVAVRGGVPPVGVEPTLGTLLGGRPLPLGYGGWVMIPRPVRTILARANRERKIRPGSHIQFMLPDPPPRSANAKRYQFALRWKNCAHSVAGQRALLGHRTCARCRPADPGRPARATEHLVQHRRGDP